MAIGARSQSAKTYLEKKFDEFADGNDWVLCSLYASTLPLFLFPLLTEHPLQLLWKPSLRKA